MEGGEGLLLQLNYILLFSGSVTVVQIAKHVHEGI